MNFFSSLKGLGAGVQQASYSFEIGILYLVVRWPTVDANLSIISSTKAKNEWHFTSPLCLNSVYKGKRSLLTSPLNMTGHRPTGSQEVEASRFQDNWYMKSYALAFFTLREIFLVLILS
jgi:hypothetical protein